MSDNDVVFDDDTRIPMKGVRYVEGADQWAIYMRKRNLSEPVSRIRCSYIYNNDNNGDFSRSVEDMSSPPFFLPFRKPNEESRDWTIIDLDESDSEDTPLEKMVFKRRALRICTVRKRKLENFRISMKKYTDELDKLSKRRNEWAKEIVSKLTALNQQMQRNA